MEHMFQHLEYIFQLLKYMFQQLKQNFHHREKTFIALCYNNLSTAFQLCSNTAFFKPYRSSFLMGIPLPQTDALAML